MNSLMLDQAAELRELCAAATECRLCTRNGVPA